ncbi:uncharacterized protein VTP21DRAFT_10597 [Calcarisporiella thermophila]|uniref:uncharacterized protein n=1 Tax=Calcarisporiella thermophila TaxID=911321 RepID=UPI003742A03D
MYMRNTVFFLLLLIGKVASFQEDISALVNRDGTITYYGKKRITTKHHDILLQLDQFPECAKKLFVRLRPDDDGPPYPWRTISRKNAFGQKYILGLNVDGGTVFTFDAKISPAVSPTCVTRFRGKLEWA